MKIFRSASSFETSHPPVIAIYCSDGRFTRPVEELGESLGHPRMDIVALPGGPAILSAPGRIGGMSGGSELRSMRLSLEDALRLACTITEADQFRRAVQFLIRAHGIREALLIAHAGCGYYADKCQGRSPAEIIGQQKAELQAAAAWLASGDTPEVAVRLYLARPAAGKVEFEPQ